jgi:hypothetical protein
MADALVACGIHVSGSAIGAGYVVPLLVARDDESGPAVDAELWLAETVAQHQRLSTISRDAKHASVVLADGRRLLAAFGDHELSAGPQSQRARELAIVRRLREGVREHFMEIRFAVAIRVGEPPDAVAIEDVDLLVADRERQGLVQS